MADSSKEDYRPLITEEGLDGDDYAHQGIAGRSRRSWRRTTVILVIAVQAVLNFALIFAWLGMYARRSPRNPIFPQALYCEHF